MERIGEQKEQVVTRNLLSEPEETIRAMAQVEGPAWLNDQNRIGERLDEIGDTEEGAVEETAHNSVPGALRYLEDLQKAGHAIGDEPRIVYKIYGAGGIHRWYVFSDGSVRFSESHAQPRHKHYAQELGFELAS